MLNSCLYLNILVLYLFALIHETQLFLLQPFQNYEMCWIYKFYIFSILINSVVDRTIKLFTSNRIIHRFKNQIKILLILIHQENTIRRMLDQDEMFKLLLNRYAPKLSKTKKQASYMLQKKQQGEQLPLNEAIKIKCDSSKMTDSYDPLSVEKYWDQWWNNNKFFHADNQTTNPKKFTITLPPPNVTGYLHIGHALTVAVQDSIVRRKRMQGYQTLYLPGTDHAGIATQTVVQKKLTKEEGKTRHDLGREKFIQKVWEFKETHEHGIKNQLRRVGASLDWDREVFTMDEQLSKSVTAGFTQLFERNLIYRATRLVNWSTALKTAISDIEVDYMQLDGRTLVQVPGYDKKVQFGIIVHFTYKMKDDPSQELQVATTRIETMLGDVAVAVHPQDPRYKDWVGKELVHPFIPERRIVVIADDFVDREFGTGAVKITPAHDPNDYACGQKHNLPFINIFTDDGLINENGGKYQGLKRFECRRIIEKDLKQLNLLREKKNNKMRLGLCSRSKDVIEPIIRPQWYVDCSQISKRMIQAVKTKEIKIIPAEQEQTWYRWIGNLRDWCISRQLWWGHRIPVYLISKKGQKQADTLNKDNWVAASTYEQALEKASKKSGIPKEQIELEQDHDVLDTWFSSGLFPFSPLKWPDTKHKDYTTFFPNQLLQTGKDILFFWVARMVMMSFWLTDKAPFNEVLLHPLVCDSQGNKMSKSRGNVIDPLEIIQGTSLDHLIKKIRQSNLSKGQQDVSVKKLKHEFPQGISECGSDALRFGLLAYMVQGSSINLNINRIISYRKFCNKIWNSFKFAMDKFVFIKNFDTSLVDPSNQSFLNSWILCKLNKVIRLVNENFDKYTLGEASNAFYNFWLYELCDIYLQATKPLFANGSQQQKQRAALTLFICLENGMRLLHPLMPFISEQLYQKLPQFQGKVKSITRANYPVPLDQNNQKLTSYFEQIQNLFESVNKSAACFRSIASSVNMPPQIKPEAFVMTDEKIIAEQTDLLATLGKVKSVKIVTNEDEIPKGCGIGTVGSTRLYLELAAHIDVKKQLQRLNKKLQELNKFKQILQTKINDKNREKIPQKIKQEQDLQWHKFIEEEKVILSSIDKIKQIK